MWVASLKALGPFYQLHRLAGAEAQSILTALDGLWWDGYEHMGLPLPRYHLEPSACAAHISSDWMK